MGTDSHRVVPLAPAEVPEAVHVAVILLRPRVFLKLLFTPGICETDLKSTHSGEECNSPAVAELWGCPTSFMDPVWSTSALEIEEPYISKVLYSLDTVPVF